MNTQSKVLACFLKVLEFNECEKPNVLDFYNTLAAIADAEDGQEIVKENDIDRMFSDGADFFHQLRFFSFGEIKLIDGVKGKYEGSIRMFLPNEFVIEVSNFLLEDALICWGINNLDYLLDELELKGVYMDGNRKKGRRVYCEHAVEHGAAAEDTAIDSLELYKGQKMLYLFDFGDEWEFDVELINIDREAPIYLEPMIIEAKGKAPDQY